MGEKLDTLYVEKFPRRDFFYPGPYVDKDKLLFFGAQEAMTPELLWECYTRLQNGEVMTVEKVEG